MTNQLKLYILVVLSILLMIIYQFIAIDMNYVSYAMMIRFPKLLSMIIASFCIGTASIVFQSIINNRIVTPCLLGMNSLYTLIHTGVIFIFGVTSIFVSNKNLSFVIDIILMIGASMLIYGYLFKKTKYNILYILLGGTVLATLFTSITDTLIRTLNPNDYTALQDRLLAGLNNTNKEIISLSLVLISIVGIIFYKDILLLDVITLGKNQAINLGIDYDKTILRLLIAVTIYIAIATAIVGPISFLGLIIANISRQLFNTYKHSYLMLGSFLSGMIILLLGQILIEHIFEFTTVISIFINLFGGIYFLYLILKSRRELV